MMSSAVGMGITGLLLTFFPQELLAYWGFSETPPVVLQLLGGLYLSFALLNWTAKANLIGGIYSRPIALGNFTHFMIGGLTLDRLALAASFPVAIVGAGLIYSLFAILFGYIFFTHPSKKVG